MDSVMNKFRLAEKRYSGKLKKDKKGIRLNNKEHKNKLKKIGKLKITIKSIIINYKKQKR